VDRDHLVGSAGEGAQKEQVFLVAREKHPFAVSAGNNGTWIHFAKVSLHLFGVPLVTMLFLSRGCIKKIGGPQVIATRRFFCVTSDTIRVSKNQPAFFSGVMG
jgi:hypothetical protein